MIKVGVTGGIGSGKTTVCQIFQTLGIPVYFSDLRAKFLMTNDKQVKSQIIEHFGEDIYLDYGLIDSKKLAKIIFNDEQKLKLINSIIHPAVENDFKLWAEKQKAPYVVKESALIFESGNYKNLDFIISVYAPLDLRIKRTTARQKLTRQQVLNRIKNQMPENKKIILSDFVIINDDHHSILTQVLNLHKFFLKQKS